MSKYIFAIISLCVISISANAQYVEWTPAMGPVAIAGVGIAPNGDLYVSSKDYFYRSTDRGLTWSANRSFLDKYTSGSISGSIVFTKIGILVGGCLTTDNGATWSHPDNAPSDPVYDPTHSYLYGGSTYQDIHHQGSPYKIVRSIDEGKSWDVLVPSDQMDSLGFAGVTSDQTLYAIHTYGGLYRYSNSWWTLVNPNQYRANAILEVEPGHLITFEGSFASRSYDNGFTWSKFDSMRLGTHLVADDPQSVVFQRNPANYVLSSNSGLFYSFDTAHTFTGPDANIHTTQCVAFGPGGLLTSNDCTVWQSYSTDPVLSGIPGSSSQRLGFPLISDFAISKWGTLYACSQTGRGNIYESGDNGYTWHPIDAKYQNLPVFGSKITCDSEGYKYLCTNYGDNGYWSYLPLTLRINPDGIVDTIPLLQIAQLVTYADGSLIARTDHGSLRSTDHGETWHDLQWPDLYIVTIDHEGRIFAFDTLNGSAHKLYRLDNLGSSWHELLPQYEDKFANTPYHSDLTPNLVVNRQGIVYIAIDSFGIFRSSDHGETWDKLPRIWYLYSDAANYAALGVDAKGTLFANTDGYGVYSTDEGKTWSTGEMAPFRFIASSPTGAVFGWTYQISPMQTSSIMRFNGTAATAAVLPNSLDRTMTSAYPNPFSNSTSFPFSLPSSSDVSVNITDALGREVWHDVKAMGEGPQEILFDGSKLSPGVYYYRIGTDKTGMNGSMVIVR